VKTAKDRANKEVKGRVADKLGLKLKKNPPPLPENFKQSPLFDSF